MFYWSGFCGVCCGGAVFLAGALVSLVGCGRGVASVYRGSVVSQVSGWLLVIGAVSVLDYCGGLGVRFLWSRCYALAVSVCGLPDAS